MGFLWQVWWRGLHTKRLPSPHRGTEQPGTLRSETRGGQAVRARPQNDSSSFEWRISSLLGAAMRRYLENRIPNKHSTFATLPSTCRSTASACGRALRLPRQGNLPKTASMARAIQRSGEHPAVGWSAITNVVIMILPPRPNPAPTGSSKEGGRQRSCRG